MKSQPILERMVTAYEKAGEWEKAYFTCKQLNDPKALAGVIERSGTAMLQTALVTLEGWINSLPPVYVRTRPGLISLRGMMAAMKGNLQEASQSARHGCVRFTERSECRWSYPCSDTASTYSSPIRKICCFSKDIEEALQLAECDPDLEPLYAEALRIKGLNLYPLGTVPKCSAGA